MKQIRQLLLKGKIQEALNGLFEHFKDDSDKWIQVEQLMIRLQNLEEDQRAGVLLDSDYRTERNKINRAVLILTHPKPTPTTRSKKWRKWIYLLGLGTILATSGFFGYNWINKREDKSAISSKDITDPKDTIISRIDTTITASPKNKKEKEIPIKTKLFYFSVSNISIPSALTGCLKKNGFKEDRKGNKIEFDYSGEIVDLKKSDLFETFVYNGGKLIIKVDGVDIGNWEFDLKRSDPSGSSKDHVKENLTKEIENLIKRKHKKICEKIYDYASK